LLESHDAFDIAAALLTMLQRERRDAREASRGAATPAGAAADKPATFTRIFVTVGARDGVRPADLVGALTGEAGITRQQIGKVDIRDTYSLVEIATPEAEGAATRLSGVSVKGRRAIARLERDRGPDAGKSQAAGARSRGPGARGYERGPRADDRANRAPGRGPRKRSDDRPPRPDDRGDRGDRGDRPPGRGPRKRSDDRPPRRRND
jgi:ATP-dependent RNA helicase DeaD